MKNYRKNYFQELVGLDFNKDPINIKLALSQAILAD